MAASKAADGGSKPRKQRNPKVPELTREMRIAGGKARGAQLRKHQAYREIIREIGMAVRAPDEIRETMIKLGMPDDTLTLDYALVVGQYMGAMQGDSRCATWIRDTVGEMPVKQLEISDKRDEMSLFDRLALAQRAASELSQQQAFVTIPITSPEIIDVELAPDDS